MIGRTTIQRLSTIALAAVAMALLHGCAHLPSSPTEADVEALRERQSGFLSALSAKDVDWTVSHFTEDAMVHIANMPPMQGHDAVRRLFENVFRFLSASEYTPEQIRVAASGDLAYSAGRVTTVFEGEDGPVEYPGKYLLVWEKREGVWSIAVYSISNNRAAPGG